MKDQITKEDLEKVGFVKDNKLTQLGAFVFIYISIQVFNKVLSDFVKDLKK